MTAHAADGAGLLRRTLLGNAGTSAACGLALVLGAGPIAAFLGVGSPALLIALGVGLLLFAAAVLRAARRPVLSAAEVRAIIAADVAWVAASVAVLALWPDLLSTAGWWTVAIVALGVADFAALQYLGLRRLGAAGRRGRGGTPSAVAAGS